MKPCANGLVFLPIGWQAKQSFNWGETDQAMVFGGLNLFTIGQLVLAMAFGALVALIWVELRKKYSTKRKLERATAIETHGESEKTRRQDVVVRLMNLYTGVNSADALSEFLNKELARRHEYWRVRIPTDGPGEIYDLEQAQ
jgi:hypothetical protein